MNAVVRAAAADVLAAAAAAPGRAFALRLSAIEIYNEVVRDLLAPGSDPLRLLDDPERGGTVADGLTEMPVPIAALPPPPLGRCAGDAGGSERGDGVPPSGSVAGDDGCAEGSFGSGGGATGSLLAALLEGIAARRATAEHDLNDASSRSHLIVRLVVESRPRRPGEASGASGGVAVHMGDGDASMGGDGREDGRGGDGVGGAGAASAGGSVGGGVALTAVLNFVDLAGTA